MAHRIIFKIELSRAERVPEPARPDKRSKSRVEPDPRLVLDRQKLAVAPDITYARRDSLRIDRALDASKVIHDLEGAKTFVAHMHGRNSVILTALAAA
jgi:hypothetical protein